MRAEKLDHTLRRAAALQRSAVPARAYLVQMIAAVRARDEPEDFEAWVAARGPALTRFAYLVCGDASESHDLVQAALEKAWPRWRSIGERGDPEAYLRRAITNGAISRWR